ncbi:MAG TPA: alpha-glucosidase [Parvularcula sp.]|nr:alpha-glucosidase [Parvularcula sp.]
MIGRFVFCALTACFIAQAAAADIAPTKFGLEARNAARILRVTALRDNIFHVEMTDAAGRWPEGASWAVTAEARSAAIAVTPAADGFTAGNTVVAIDPQTLALTFRTSSGAKILDGLTDAPSSGGAAFEIAMPVGQRIFGMGDKTGSLDRAGRSFINWNTDAYKFTSSTDPLYKSIPFFIASGAGRAPYGLFFDNTFRTRFDFGARTPDRIRVDADGGALDLYVITGASIGDIVRGYASLTGRAPMPPRFAFGYQQSRWSYMTEAEVRELVDRFRAERFPLDVIWLDIDYQDRSRPFTVDRKAFPRIEALIADLRRGGVHSVPIVDLHIAAAPGETYAPFDSGVAGDHFLKRADGSLYVAPVWPGPSAFPDFTRTRTRRWWGRMFKMFTDMGVGGVWNDMNEPAIFETPSKTMPLDVAHRIEGSGFTARTASHAEIHNIYGMENSRATFEGLLALAPRKRPFVMTRATYAGGQRYATTWSGDNGSTFDHLKLAVQQMLSLGLSGFPFPGNDVGGFTGGASAELMTRWNQYAAFMPLFRNHSQKDAPRAEPWVDGEAELAIRRRYVEERYRLLPFLYALAAEASGSGEPMMRPLFYDFAAMLASGCDQSMHFTLGGRLLVAGNPRPESPRVYEACLPEGGWYDYWTGARVAAGETLTIAPRHETLPVFVRAGSIIPRQALVQHTDETPKGPLELHIYPGPDCAGALYDDDGFARGGAFRRQVVACEVADDGGVTVQFAEPEGRYRPWWREIALIVHDGVGERRKTISAPRGAEIVTLEPA